MNRAQLLWSADSEGLKSNVEVGAALNNICVLNVCVYTVEVGAVLTFFFFFCLFGGARDQASSIFEKS